MADPVTLGAVAIGATVAGGAVSAYGSYAGGKAQKAAYDYQAGIAAINSKIASQNADYARRVGEVVAQRKGMESRFVLGNAKVAQGASNLDVGRGSPVDVRTSIHEIGVENQAVARADAAKKAYGYEVGAMEETAKGEMAKVAGANAEKAGDISATGTLLGTAGSVASKWTAGNQSGLWSGGNSGWVGDSGHSGWIDNPSS